MNVQKRIESKYILSHGQFYAIKSSLMGKTRLDHYSSVSDNSRYLVQSVYFDNYAFENYEDKMAGIGIRNKLRIRTYLPTETDNATVKVEEKRRDGPYVYKFQTTVDVAEYAFFREHSQWPTEGNPVLDDFEKIVRLKSLKPVVVVAYDREAYVAHDDKDVRITFDHNIRYARSANLFCPQSNFRRDFHKNVVLEIKTTSDANPWLSYLAKNHNLKSVPNSKYANAVEQSSHNLRIF